MPITLPSEIQLKAMKFTLINSLNFSFCLIWSSASAKSTPIRKHIHHRLSSSKSPSTTLREVSFLTFSLGSHLTPLFSTHLTKTTNKWGSSGCSDCSDSQDLRNYWTSRNSNPLLLTTIPKILKKRWMPTTDLKHHFQFYSSLKLYSFTNCWQ